METLAYTGMGLVHIKTSLIGPCKPSDQSSEARKCMTGNWLPYREHMLPVMGLRFTSRYRYSVRVHPNLYVCNLVIWDLLWYRVCNAEHIF